MNVLIINASPRRRGVTSTLLAEAIKEADLLVIGSPVYWGNIPGTLKIIFDRNVPLFEYCEAKAIRYIPRPQLTGKKAILIVSGGTLFPFNLLSSQSRGTVRALKTVLKAGGVKVASVINVPDSYEFEKSGQRYLRKVRRIADSMST